MHADKSPLKHRLALSLIFAVAAGFVVGPGQPLPAQAEIVTCANVDRPVPLVSKVPGASITGYRMDRFIDTDIYEGCRGSEDSVYRLTVQLHNTTRAQLSNVDVECKVYADNGLLMDRLKFGLKFATALDPGDSGRANASANSTHAKGERLDCVLNSAT